jgi:Tol biopolymer transport system component
MKRLILLLTCAGVILALSHRLAFAQSAEELYQKAVQLETVKGELEQAIGVYKNIISRYAANQALAAKSLLHMGLCYEKLGKNEAKKAYERIIKEYANQPDVVAKARARLAVLTAGTKEGSGPVARRILSDNIEPEIENPAIIYPSPDGQWVAYTQEEVCIRNLETNEVKQVAPGRPAFSNWSVVWSPDGKRLAYWQKDLKTNTGSVIILDLTTGGTTTVLKSGKDELYLLDWSRDGRHLLCNHEGKNTLELIKIKEGTVTILSDSVWYGQRSSFSPDGRCVTYAKGPYGFESVYTQSIAGGPSHKIAEIDKGAKTYLHPLWSPDGKWIAYQQEYGIWLRPVTDGVPNGPARVAYKTTAPRWAVTWKTTGFYMTYNGEYFHAYQVAVDAETGKLAREGAQTIPDSPGGFSDFAWSADRRHIVYTGWQNTIQIYSSDTKASSFFDVGHPTSFWPWFSEDGKEVFYNTADPATQKGVVKALNLQNGKVRDLFQPISGFMFSFSSDGQRMAYNRRGNSPGTGEIVVAETGQSDGRVVASGSVWVHGRLSPQGDRVVYARRDVATRPLKDTDAITLCVVSSDGSGLRPLATALGINSAIWDPSGRFVAYTAFKDTTTYTRSLRVIDAETGIETSRIDLPPIRRIQVTEWSSDGKFIGVYSDKPFWEYWVIENLEEGGK